MADDLSIAKHPFAFLIFVFICIVTPWNLVALLVWKPQCEGCKRTLGPWEAFNSPIEKTLLYMCPSCRLAGVRVGTLKRRLFKI